MPFKSKAQQAFLFATNPKVAKEMASKTSKKQFARLPQRVKKSMESMKSMKSK